MHQRVASATQWPVFAPEAQRRGFQSAWALPMRLRGEVIGALNMFSGEEAGLAPDDLTAAQALTDVATVAVVQYRAASNAQAMNEQMNGALRSRVLNEQAKGALAERLDVDVEAAFAAMRAFARRNGLHLTDVANGVVAGTVEISKPPVAGVSQRDRPRYAQPHNAHRERFCLFCADAPGPAATALP